MHGAKAQRQAREERRVHVGTADANVRSSGRVAHLNAESRGLLWAF